MVSIGADHQGFKLKEYLKSYFKKKKVAFEDIGVFHDDKKVDYPDYAFEVGTRVSGKKNARGILVCGSGIGMVVAANKIKGIRAGQAQSVIEVQRGRRDDDMNILVLSAWTAKMRQAKILVDVFLKTRFGTQKRYRRRLKKVENFESKHWK